MMLKTFKYRLYPTPAQERQLRLCLDAARNWYNMCVAERKYAWELEGRRVTKNDQLRLVKRYKAAFRQFKDVHSHILQVATAQCDAAFQHFFRRVKAGQKAGYPRFKGYYRFNSFGLKEYGNGFRLDGKRLKVTAVGRLRVRWHRPLEGNLKTVRFMQQAGQWFVCFTCELPDPAPLAPTGKAVGIDLNVENLLHDSDNRRVESPQHYRAAQRELRIAQRGLQRKQQGGKNRRKALLHVQRLHEHIRTPGLTQQASPLLHPTLRPDCPRSRADPQSGTQPPPQQEHSGSRLGLPQETACRQSCERWTTPRAGRPRLYLRNLLALWAIFPQPHLV
jgi:putative transposase